MYIVYMIIGVDKIHHIERKDSFEESMRAAREWAAIENRCASIADENNRHVKDVTNIVLYRELCDRFGPSIAQRECGVIIS